MRHLSTVILIGLALLAGTRSATAQDLRFNWKAYVESQARVMLEEPFDYERFETALGGEFTGRYGNIVIGKAHLEVTYTEINELHGFEDLLDRHPLDPFRIESDALFIEFTNAGLDGLDIAIGRRQEIWGTGAGFRPVSNLNPLDVEDPLAFGEVIANEMISVRYSPYLYFGDEDEPWFEEFSLQLVVVPYFKPAQLPGSAAIAFTDVDEQYRRATTPALKLMVEQQRSYIASGASVRYDVEIERPDFAVENTQFGARMAWKLLGIDMGFSYYRGFDDFPRAESAVVTGDSGDVTTALTLSYPRMQVLGIDAAASLPFLDGLGVWGEVAIHFHDDLFVTIDGRKFAGNSTGSVFPNGPEREYEEGYFVKAVAGIDYTPLPWWYLNVQYLYGFVDEFGASSLWHYLVGVMEFYMWSKRITLRLATIVALPRPEDSSLLRAAEPASAVLYPQITIAPFAGAEFSVGAFAFLGDSDSKFGSPVAGVSTLFVKGRVTF